MVFSDLLLAMCFLVHCFCCIVFCVVNSFINRRDTKLQLYELNLDHIVLALRTLKEDRLHTVPRPPFKLGTSVLDSIKSIVLDGLTHTCHFSLSQVTLVTCRYRSRGDVPKPFLTSRDPATYTVWTLRSPFCHTWNSWPAVTRNHHFRGEWTRRAVKRSADHAPCQRPKPTGKAPGVI